MGFDRANVLWLRYESARGAESDRCVTDSETSRYLPPYIRLSYPHISPRPLTGQPNPLGLQRERDGAIVCFLVVLWAFCAEPQTVSCLGHPDLPRLIMKGKEL
jgi:hypothetical protein